jgi:hypothetical protein
MPPKPMQDRRESPAPPDSITPTPDALPGDLRREDQTAIAPDTLPLSEDELDEDEPLGAHRMAPDGGAEDHPIHDDDPSEDFTPRDYEEQIEKVAEAREAEAKRATADEP